ncbi:hypothetical protein [Fluviispira vulneris]|uniref:hypothetical protein n=1 Tax=Fluviispira vulneris TaxID=2763012 RepID=UPI0016464169|nr:hypothetical protein [Fluviispira vulneris]
MFFLNIQLIIKNDKYNHDENFLCDFFPEATSTEGKEIRAFKKPLFQSAILSQSSVLPLCINYLKIDGENLNIGK